VLEVEVGGGEDRQRGLKNLNGVLTPERKRLAFHTLALMHAEKRHIPVLEAPLLQTRA
jgi:hypothetical protein